MTDVNTSGVPIQSSPASVASAMALANASMVAAGVVKGLAGRAVSDSINGSPIMQEQLTQMVCARITQRLRERVENARINRLNGYQ